MYPMRRAAPSGCAGVCGSTGDGGCVDSGATGGNSPSIRTGRIFSGQTGRIFGGQTGRIFGGQRWGRSGVEAGYDSAAWLGGLLAAEWVTGVPARADLGPAGLT